MLGGKRGKEVLKLSKKVVTWLKPLSRRVMVVGSIRRKKPNPKDIDVVLIPKNREKLEEFMKKKGRFAQGGEHESTWKIGRIKVELYYTIPKEWGAALLAYSSKPGSGIGLRMVAKRRGYKLNNHGLFNVKTGRRIAGKTEREIYKALGRPYKEPENR